MAIKRVDLSRTQIKFLEQERSRLRAEYGINVTISDIIRGLVDLHMTRFALQAETSPDTIAWFYRHLAKREKDDQPK